MLKITLPIDKNLAGKICKIAAERGITVAALIRTHLEELVGERAKSAEQRRQIEALERSFKDLRLKMGEITWTRAELHERPLKRTAKRASE